MAVEGKDVVELKGKIYKCESCGSVLRFDPDSGKLKCRYCSSEYDLDQPKNAMELVYTDKSETGFVGWGGTKSYKCRSCGASVVLNDYETAANCPFCDTPNIAYIDDIPGLKPNAILPFKISEEKAQDCYIKWLKSKKMAPSNLKKIAEKVDLKGVYIPIFTFDTNTYSKYTIRYGQHYTVTVGTGKNRHTEVRTRWYTDSGSINNAFNDLQVEASEQITQKDLSKLGLYDTDNAFEYNSQYISGYFSERYTSSLDSSWEIAKSMADSSIRSAILSRYNYDVLDYCNVSTSYEKRKYKYVLVPLWVAKYRYKKKIYSCYINGRTGAGTGKAPVSPVKATGLGIAIAAVVGVIIYFVYRYLVG